MGFIINPYLVQPSGDADAQAFITAAGITDSTQKSAIQTLVTDLKTYGIWTKMSALYPFVGGTATTHKYNLKDPQDTNAAFRLVFSGGGTHSANGYQTNGVNAFAETYYNPFNNLTDINSNHISIYSRTNNQGGIDMGGGPVPLVDLSLNFSGAGGSNCWNMASYVTHYNLDSRCLMINTRTASNLFKVIKNGSVLVSSTGSAGATKPNTTYHIGKRNLDSLWTNREYAFASIGDGLNDTEAANFYTAVQAFQTTLGRSVGTQTVSDADAQAFVTAANITDQVQATAINDLVIGMKADGLWTKMKAVYPFVGGTAASHKYNLKDPQDTDGAFRLVFSGGWTHSSTGADPGGVNGYADTKFNQMNSWTSTSNASAGIYLRENVASTAVDIGASSNAGNGDNSTIIYSRYTGDNFYGSANGTGVSGAANTNSQGFFAVSRTNTTQHSIYKRGSSTINQTSSVNIGTNINKNIYIGAANNNGVADYFSNREIAFAFFGDGLTQSEVGDYYTRVQTFNTALNRQV